MKLKNTIILFCLGLAIQLPGATLFSQDAPVKPTRESSGEAFSRGDYEKAYLQYRELLLMYNKDPLYKYYSGVCLVKLNRDPAEATSLLLQAIQTAGSVKPLPPDRLFYLARAQQMSGKYDEAINTFNAYSEQVGKKTSQEMGVTGFQEQCRNRKGQLTGSVNPLAENEVSGETKTVEPVKKTAEALPVSGNEIPVEYEKVLGEAVMFQFKADSITSLVNSQNSEMEKLPSSRKPAQRSAIAENEKAAASFQSAADQRYKEAKTFEASREKTFSGPKAPVAMVETAIVEDTGSKTDSRTVKSASKQDTARSIVAQVGVYSFFDASGKAVTDPKEKIAMDPEVPPGLIYRIQLAVFRNPVTPSYFKGITPVYGFKIEATDKIIYYAGMFRKNADAVKALSVVKSKGFKDSFIVPLSANKRVSSDRAASLEKEWGTKSFYTIEKSISKTEADTAAQTLSFRVELRRSANPLTDELVVEMRKMAGSRGMDIMQLQTGEISYLIGKFITFESAAEYADLMKRNGYRDAQVAAWLGRKEIPVETAKKLFDDLK